LRKIEKRKSGRENPARSRRVNKKKSPMQTCNGPVQEGQGHEIGETRTSFAPALRKNLIGRKTNGRVEVGGKLKGNRKHPGRTPDDTGTCQERAVGTQQPDQETAHTQEEKNKQRSRACRRQKSISSPEHQPRELAKKKRTHTISIRRAKV